MSKPAWARALQDPRLRGADKLVLLAIIDHDGPGGSWPSKDTIARETGYSLSTVKRALRHLSALGLIEVRHNAGGNAATRPDRRPNRYIVRLNGGSRMAPRRGVTHDPLTTPVELPHRPVPADVVVLPQVVGNYGTTNSPGGSDVVDVTQGDAREAVVLPFRRRVPRAD